MPPTPRRTDEPTVRLPVPGAAPETPPSPDLTVSKVLAAGGAAATSAVIGSFTGAAGTVTGAAIGAVASTIAAVLYQRSLERTRVVLARVRPGATVPGPRPSPEETTVLAPAPPPRRRRRRVVAVVLGVLAFALALLAVTGVELVRGSTIGSGESGTSVGRVVAPPPAEPGTDDGSGDEESTTPTDEAPTDDAPTDDADTGDGGETGDAGDRGDRSAGDDPDATSQDAGVTETPAPDEDSDPDVPPEDDADAPPADDRSTG